MQYFFFLFFKIFRYPISNQKSLYANVIPQPTAVVAHKLRLDRLLLGVIGLVDHL